MVTAQGLWEALEVRGRGIQGGRNNTSKSLEVGTGAGTGAGGYCTFQAGLSRPFTFKSSPEGF